MGYIEKEIKISENRTLRYTYIDEGIPNIEITEMFFEPGKPAKSYTFAKWHDYRLDGWIDDYDDSIRQISFDIDQNHPLFVPFLHLLNCDDSLIIDDDMTREETENYISISRIGKTVRVEFFNNPDVNTNSESFYITVIGAHGDGRSKIDQQFKDTKERLARFFQDAYYLVFGQSQLSMESYFLNPDDGEMRKAFKIDFTKPKRNIEGEE